MPLTFINWALAAAPIIAVLILMLGFRWGGSKAGAIAYFITIIIAFFVFKADFEVIAYAQAKAVLLTLDVLFIIWMALLLFNVANEAGAIEIIGKKLPSLTADKTMQGLLLGWLFTSFLQGMGGFGVPVAIVAPLMVSLGFTPIQSVILASLGHCWAVTFGSLGTSFQTLIATTGIAGELLAPETAILLGAASFISGLIVAFMSGGWKGLARSLPAVLIIGSLMSVTQYLLATNGLWNLGATGAALVGLLAGVLLARLPLYQKENGVKQDDEDAEQGGSIWLAMSSYAILIVIAFGIYLIPSINGFLGQLRLTLQFPELETGLGWVTDAGPGRSLKVFNHPGAILLYTSIIGYLIYKRTGSYKEAKPLKTIFSKMSASAVKSSLGIAAMVSVAVIMSNAGMTNMLAKGLSESVDASLYPAVAPFIGAIGAFITGSNTNSNVIFSVLQMQTAEMLGLSVTLILAAQTAGGALGSVIAPAKVIVGCSTVGLAGEEGPVIARKIGYGVLMISVIALIAWLMSQGM